MMTRLKNTFKLYFKPDRKPKCDTMAKTSHKRKASFNSLPDEIVLLILSQPILDLDTIHNVMKLSKRMLTLSFCVLSNHTFPFYKLETIIDQEGRNRTFTDFEFQGMDIETQAVCFVARSPSTTRYYTNKEPPVIRQVMIKGHTAPSNIYTVNVTQELDSLSEIKKSEKNTQPDQDKSSATDQTPPKIIIETRNQKIHKVQCDGFYSVQSSRLSSSLHNKNYSVTLKQMTWKFGYQIKHKEKKEYYFTPLYLDLHFNYLLKLIQCTKNKKLLS